MGLHIVTGPAVEPLTLDDTKVHLRVPQELHDEDGLIDTLIRSARQYVETFTQRALITQTWDWRLDAFPCAGTGLQLPVANVTSVTSVTYTDMVGASQTWSSSLYQTDLPVGPHAQRARLMPAYAQSYPTTRDQLNAVVVRFVAGYGADGSAVPDSLLAGMKVLIGHWFMNREAVVVGVGTAAVPIPAAVDALLWPYRVF